MVLKRVNNLIVIFIILCSTSFYKFSFLGQIQKVAELLGAGLIVLFILLHLVYTEQKHIKHNFVLPVSLILLSVLTSMFMAKFSRGQSFGQTMFAQRAMYYYFFYFLLHQLRIRPKDLEMIFLSLGIVYVILYLVQFAVYPKILYDAYVRADRGTIRIYLTGSDYWAISLYMSVQYFFRTNKPKYLFLMLLFFSLVILMGGRQNMAIVGLIVLLFLIIDKRVKSRLLLFMLGLGGAFLVFIIFQNIFQAIFLQTKSDTSLGDDYIRLKAAQFFLTDFFKTPLAYFTGNGMYYNTSKYGQEIAGYMVNNRYFLGDIGIIGNFALYGSLFVVGVLIINFKSLIIKIEKQYMYIKYLFIAIILSLITGGGFIKADFICFITGVLYLIDVSNFSQKQHLEQNNR